MKKYSLQRPSNEILRQWEERYQRENPEEYEATRKYNLFLEQMYQRVLVFEDTMNQVLSKTILTNSITTKVRVEDITQPINHDYDMIVKTVNSDTVTAANVYAKFGRTCALNMASAKTAGGGVAHGAQAQEECLFRCSNLFETVLQEQYPLSPTEGMYTQNAVFFKDREYANITPFNIDVATVAAINLNPNARFEDIEEHQSEVDNYDQITLDKIRLVLHQANLNGCENLILGAWGCGVFNNSPVVIADMFKEVLEDYQGCFKNVVFAVINDHNSVGDNYDIFDAAFNK